MPEKARHGLKAAGELIWANTDKITKWVQVLALVIAAYWAVTRFLLVDAPSLQRHAEVSTTRSEYFKLQSDCYVSQVVSIRNAGVRSFDITKIEIRAWRTNLPGLKSEDSKFVNFDEIEGSKPVIQTELKPEALVRRYSPNDGSHQTFTWDIPVGNFSLTIFRADAYSGDDKVGYAEDYQSTICQP